MTPRPSPLRPHVSAAERLRCWRPRSARSSPTPAGTGPLSLSAQRDRILTIMERSWAESTRATYATGLLVFHVYCDVYSVAEEERCPVSPFLLLSFLATCAGSYSRSSLANFAAGLRAWHVLHLQPWLISPPELKAILDGAAHFAPASSTRPRRAPFTTAVLDRVKNALDLTTPLDAAVFACITTIFYSVSRVGEFTVRNVATFNPRVHITRADVQTQTVDDGSTATVFRLPWTKVAKSAGEYTRWVPQPHLESDPQAALANHLHVSPGRPTDPLFGYATGATGRIKPLSWRTLNKRLKAIPAFADEPLLTGHSLRIGGTLHYLLKRVPFDVVRVHGRWFSDAFTLYLREHARILAPYLGPSPALAEFTARSLPRIR
ncbi:hypothetical protein CONPUDRAFT_159627 [Coniophora puteana RWD-64-598 SS2]|uniref:DNA breaking-rejoining enzyme n=1 Tax=Coniophora puteana (strain RWD-64-598) TaxID=741705 RepID=A0A5M3M7G1_CONPW|nr:uncharacterized protein CONPUDRAFT_159627 [Coniophora puteana RWD-64-598 SS2]EIW74856.1 hypothetical protein CONPUDRAFT_159627 [Coniophora puteana RWD-64-598 SS2]